MVPTISKEELNNKLRRNQHFHLIDVLEPEEYQQLHIKGAINIPYHKIGYDAEGNFDKGEEIIVYCSDYDCTSSLIAARKLQQLGYHNIYRYAGGKKEWMESNMPVEKGSKKNTG